MSGLLQLVFMGYLCILRVHDKGHIAICFILSRQTMFDRYIKDIK